VKGVSDWNEGGQGTRDFKTLEEHDEHIISQFNKYVKEGDTLWHLGDWSFGGIEQIYRFYQRLNCKFVHIILGNHDHHIENNREYNGIKAQDLFLSVRHVYFGKIGGRTFYLSHFAHRVWNKSHHGVIHLYGHSHDTLDNTGLEWGKSMDVSLESSLRYFGEMRPFDIDHIGRIMDKRSALIVDHHNSKTN
jgi:calcineurin-like phosphoesterase family protein